MPNERDPLDPWLDEIQPPANQAPMAPEVWRRLALAAESPRSAADGWWSRFQEPWARPSFAAAFVAACVLLGLFLAEARVSRRHAERDLQLAQSYLQLIDPLLPPAAPPATAQEVKP